MGTFDTSASQFDSIRHVQKPSHRLETRPGGAWLGAEQQVAFGVGPGPTPSAQLARDVAVSNARADLAAVKNLLIQMKVSEVRAKLEHVSQP